MSQVELMVLLGHQAGARRNNVNEAILMAQRWERVAKDAQATLDRALATSETCLATNRELQALIAESSR